MGKATWLSCFLCNFKRETKMCEGFPNWHTHIQFGYRAYDAASTHTCLYYHHNFYASLQGPRLRNKEEENSTMQSLAIPNSSSASSATSATQSCIDIWQKSGGSKEGSWWRYARCPCEAHPDAGFHCQLHAGLKEAIAAWREHLSSLSCTLQGTSGLVAGNWRSQQAD